MRYKVLGWTVWHVVKGYARWQLRKQRRKVSPSRPLLIAGATGAVIAAVYAASRRA
jgi:hypothetical protein